MVSGLGLSIAITNFPWLSHGGPTQDRRAFGTYSRDLSRSRCEVLVPILWILCVAAISLKTRLLGGVEAVEVRRQQDMCTDDGAEVL
jgi:hypothetical protein